MPGWGAVKDKTAANKRGETMGLFYNCVAYSWRAAGEWTVIS
jgi:hypothetical protein